MKKKILASIIPALMAAQAANATELAPVVVSDSAVQVEPNLMVKSEIEQAAAGTSDLVEVLADSPKISVNQAGGISGFPVMNGFADNRLNVQVDGMQLVASCPNHMNTPLSYVAPSQAESIEIYPGITPASQGGDSIGGSILVKTAEPFFAPNGEQLTQGEVGTYYRSNGNAKGANLEVTTATDKVNITYKGNYAEADNYSAASDFKTFSTTTSATAGTEFTDGTQGTSTAADEVAATAYKSINHQLSLALKGDDSLFKVSITKQSVPYEQYPNQRMDMTANESTKLNLEYEQDTVWGAVRLQAYSEDVNHEMAFMDYKIQMQMPMATESNTNGFKAATDITLSDNSLLTIGTEVQKFTLNDYWVANPASAGMSPNTFWNINNGTRDRYAAFAEWQAQVNEAWKTRLGARFERVQSDADEVQGYHDADTFTKPNGQTEVTNEQSEATAFNTVERARTDHNLSLTALASYQHSDNLAMDFGLARQVRSPNLYERYTWSSWTMPAVMNNFVGDGNGYVGDINLQPEVAYTLSANFDWHAADKKQWGIQVMPYFSYVQDYIDGVALSYTPDQFNVLQYRNQDARIYGVDVAANRQLGENTLGAWTAKAKLNYAQGYNLETNDRLYNIMPLNATLSLMQQMNRWRNMLEIVMVSAKEDVSLLRNELATPGYTLVNLKFSYALKDLRIDFGVDNIFNRDYVLPTGGVYTGEGRTMAINGIPMLAVPGMGRNLYLGLNLKF
ncbi:TonB-dependent receptor [Thiosulfatimonas sediminis]|uniref:TonB-dependent receptor n=1 Tax=Thiosulfatimonas sediminis TaxID=2675054 RepID=A0A6F8PTB2_9GAMM|nr:TonB-dependent receptor [Thiosulfatimonas sediminis]BBP45355.1 TonB-dependent receptor [Thiosulfatimonas sediminis]